MHITSNSYAIVIFPIFRFKVHSGSKTLPFMPLSAFFVKVQFHSAEVRDNCYGKTLSKIKLNSSASTKIVKCCQGKNKDNINTFTNSEENYLHNCFIFIFFKIKYKKMVCY